MFLFLSISFALRSVIGVDDFPDCHVTISGPDPGKPCALPFIFQGINYQDCTTDVDLDGRFWCSTKTDARGQHIAGQDNWGYCNSNCSLPDDSAVRFPTYDLPEEEIEDTTIPNESNDPDPRLQQGSDGNVSSETPKLGRQCFKLIIIIFPSDTFRLCVKFMNFNLTRNQRVEHGFRIPANLSAGCQPTLDMLLEEKMLLEANFHSLLVSATRLIRSDQIGRDSCSTVPDP